MEDLFYRIRAFNIHIPKLTERVEDIPVLAENFLEGYVRERREAGNPCPAMRLHPKCVDMLCAYEWKGNVRQLKNVIEATGAFAAAEDACEVEIATDLLVKIEPGLAMAVSSGCVFDGMLAEARIVPGLWTDLTEADACTCIRPLLSASAKVQFEAMLCALHPRKHDVAPNPPGRDSQDPATVHCLKVLLYLLLCREQRVSVQEILALLQVRAWDTGKKIMRVLAAEIQASPSFAPFLAMPSAGTRQVARLLPGIRASSP
jgi:hypothetical protein